GTPYAPGRDGVGLLNVADPACWDLVRPILLPGD
ncbi:MAG: inositol monophosphatase, partial [Catenulispora sp.]|nr:inositol monophosphatase [Catenulispora sp.]